MKKWSTAWAYFMDYIKDGKYQQVNAYMQTPFIVEVDATKPQILEKQFKVVFKDSVTFNLSTTFEGGPVRLENYGTKEIKSLYVEEGEFSQDFKIGQKINPSFF